MIIKYGENSYLNVDAVELITGDYTSENEDDWMTHVIIVGVPFAIQGRIGKNVMDSYTWKNKHAFYDMIHDSPNYRKKVN